MPAVAFAGAAFAGMFAAANTMAFAVISTAVSSAIIGAAVGFATAIISGENPLEGALKGAGIGAVGGAVMGGLGAAASGAGSAGTSVSGGAMAGQADVAGLAAAESAANSGVVANAWAPPTGSPVRAPLVGTPSNLAQASPVPASATATAAAPVAPTGLVKGATNWLGENSGELLGKAIGGIGEAGLRRKELEAEMENNRLNREANQVTGLDKTVPQSLPSIKSFTTIPKWRSAFSEA